jgi:Fe-S-cluster containining protein
VPATPTSDRSLAESWLTAASAPSIASGLESVYLEVASAIAARAPVCWSSGRCCNFEATGHRLYVTGLEAAYTLTRLPAEIRISTQSVAEARARGGCPFQSANLCTVHAIKPLGCRIYFCDRSAELWQQELSERMLQQIRELHDRHRLDYRYAEWRSLLESIVPFLPAGAAPEPALSPPVAGAISLPLLRPRHES